MTKKNNSVKSEDLSIISDFLFFWCVLGYFHRDFLILKMLLGCGYVSMYISCYWGFVYNYFWIFQFFFHSDNPFLGEDSYSQTEWLLKIVFYLFSLIQEFLSDYAYIRMFSTDLGGRDVRSDYWCPRKAPFGRNSSVNFRWDSADESLSNMYLDDLLRLLEEFS